MVTLTGSTRNESITGGVGGDTITAGAGNDSINGDTYLANGSFEGAGLASGFDSVLPLGWSYASNRNSAVTDGTVVGAIGDEASAYFDTGNVIGTINGIQQTININYNTAISYNLQVDVGAQMINSAPVTAEFLVGGVVV